jgi:hypothetical protein
MSRSGKSESVNRESDIRSYRDQRETGGPSVAHPVMVVGLDRRDARSDEVVRWWGVFAKLNLACLHQGVHRTQWEAKRNRL